MVYLTAVLALLGIGGTILGAGFLSGQIQNLVAFILNNTGTLFIFGSATAGLLIAVKNSFSPTPMWEKDLKYTGGILAVFGVVLFAGPAAAGMLQGKEAQATITVNNPSFSPPEITSVTVKDFSNPSLVNDFSFSMLSFFDLKDNIDGKAVIVCESYKRDKIRHFKMSVTEETTSSVTLQLSGLPPSDTCIINTQIENQNGKQDSLQKQFTVPG